MADKKETRPAKAFRWIGLFGPMDDRKGVLHIDRPDDPENPRRVVQPGQTVKDPLNLAVFTTERVDYFVKNGWAEYLDVLEKLGIGEVDKVSTDSTPAEILIAEDAAAQAAALGAGFKGLAEQRVADGRADDARLTGASLGPAGPIAPTAAPASSPADDLLGGGQPAGPRA